MSTPASSARMCPLLGLALDPSSAHLYASDQHRCYATEEGQPISLSHQEQFCLARTYAHCPIYKAASSGKREPAIVAPTPTEFTSPAVEQDDEDGYRPSPLPLWQRVNPNRAAVVIAIAIVLFVLGYFGILLINRPSRSGDDGSAAALLATRTVTVTRGATVTSTPRPTLAGTPTVVDGSRPTPPPGGQLLSLNPSLYTAGWVASNERTGNHFDDSVIQVGSYDKVVYFGMIQFDLAAIPAGMKIVSAALEVTGLDAERIGPGTWQIKSVKMPSGKPISALNYEDVRALSWDYLLTPTLTRDQLGKGKVNHFELTGGLLASVEQQFGQGKVTFRLEGPTGNTNSLFVWDVGLGGDGLGSRPVLYLGIKAEPVERALDMVVVPCVPTPASEAERQVRAATATYVATVFGTPTPYPTNYVTPVLVTAVPTEQAVFAAATQVAQGTPQGAPTATPGNWIQPVIITNTPTPVNQATAVMQRALATAMAATTGTPTPYPCNFWTATPLPPEPTATNTPVILYPDGSPTPTPKATATPASIPSILIGKIIFMSDRDGSPALYVMDPDGSRVGKLTNPWSYDVAYQRQSRANGMQLAVTGNKQTVGTKIVLAIPNIPDPKTLFEDGGINYDPVFSPDGYNVAFVSTRTGADEIYRINRDAGGFQQLTTGSTWQWNKHPSWSPDGQQIVWWSNRDVGRKQIWIMNADGSKPRNLSKNEFNDWDPVWVR